MNFKRRVGRLEKEFAVVMEVRRIRVVSTRIIGVLDASDGCDVPVSQTEEPLGLVSCDRHFREGIVFESVWINGIEIPSEEIDRYVESFPIRGLPPNQKFRIAGAASK
jgi:hypothetical protein